MDKTYKDQHIFQIHTQKLHNIFYLFSLYQSKHSFLISYRYYLSVLLLQVYLALMVATENGNIPVSDQQNQ